MIVRFALDHAALGMTDHSSWDQLEMTGHSQWSSADDEPL